MARRNRKRVTVDGFTFPVPFAGLVVVISSLALGYVWLGCRCEALGKDLKRLEMEKAELTKRCLSEEYNWIRLKSPQNMERVLAKWGIVMSWPRRDQVIRLSGADMAAGRAVDAGERPAEYARASRTVSHE